MTARTEDNDLEVSLLERYCSGTASAVEAARIDAWFREHPDQHVWYEQLRAGLKKGDFSPLSDEQLDARLTKFILAALQRQPAYDGERGSMMPSGLDAANVAGQTSLEYSDRRLGTGPQTFQAARQKEGVFSRRLLRREVWYTLAGCMLGAVVLAIGWRIRATEMLKGLATPESAYTTYATTNGQRATITLPDGNTVALDVASQLEVPTNYGAGNHAVRLPVGEALFTVSHHAGAPFTVIAGATTARVLGTSFVVRHYPTDTVALVAVRDGKVAVGATVVTAQHLVEIGQLGVRHVRSANPSQFAFATGVLALDRMRLSGAISELNRWYNVDIRLGDSALSTQMVEGTFTAGSVADLAEILESTFDVHVLRNGRVLTLYPRRK